MDYYLLTASPLQSTALPTELSKATCLSDYNIESADLLCLPTFLIMLLQQIYVMAPFMVDGGGGGENDRRHA